MINREIDREEIVKRLNAFRVTAILGPRQSGKTTLARTFDTDNYFDLENPRDLVRLDSPQITLENLQGLIVIDEIQRKPDLFPLLRYLVDTNPDQKYLILGSASQELIRQSSETLAGRISYFQLSGLRIHDIPAEKAFNLWIRGGLPPAYTADTDEISMLWRDDYIRTFLERDISMLGFRVSSETLGRFWKMLSFYHGNILNFSEIGRSFGVSDTATRHYIDILQGTFMLRLLQPWYANIGKRLVKRPKVYIRDSGIYHSLLSISNLSSLQSSPKLGASWEGFALDCVWKSIGKKDELAYFWATHSGAEVDLLWEHENRLYACEFKYADAPKRTKSMLSAVESLNLHKLWVVYPGKESYAIDKNIQVLSFYDIPTRWEY